MIPYVTYFDLDGSGRFLPLLRRFFAGWANACGSPMLAPLTILTDLGSDVGPIPRGFAVCRVDPKPYLRDFYRPGNPGAAFDYKACLILALLETVERDQPAVVMDCDNLVLGDVVDELSPFPPGFALGADPGRRVIRHPQFAPHLVIEESSSILVFPQDGRRCARDYMRWWSTSSEPAEPLLEQRTWSLVQAVDPARRVILPRAFSWSREWGPAPADCVLRHLHGGEKWEGLSENLRAET